MMQPLNKYSRWVFAALLLASTASCGDEAGSATTTADPASRLPGGSTTNTLLLGTNAFSRPVENVTIEHEMRFFTGNSFFNQGWVTAPSSTKTRDGLGPLFNARSCASCHFKDGRGAPPLSDDPSDFDGLLLRIGQPEGDGHRPHPTYGGQIQPFGIQGVPGEARQRVTYATIEGEYADGTPYELLNPTYQLDEWAYGDPGELYVSPRVAPQMIGLGLLEAIPQTRLEELADPDDVNGDGISGRPGPGRFGWKAEQPDIASQNAAAFLGDIGITSPLFSEQNCGEGQDACSDAIDGGDSEIEPHLFERVNVYTSLLAVPVRRGWGEEPIVRGEAIFEEARCGDCHTPRHQTGTHSLGELSDQTIFPYTDLLLHDMGPGLSDGRPAASTADAGPNEWRTPPLWGIGLFEDVNGHQRLLHDGRARGVAEAILWHGGEAQASRDNFIEMTQQDREDLIAFIESL